MTDSHFLNDLNDLDLNDRFFTFLRLPSMRIFLFLLCFCNKLLIENDRKYYLSATYVISGKESQGESLHSARKCCIFAPAIERTAFCALLGSSIKTNTGHK